MSIATEIDTTATGTAIPFAISNRDAAIPSQSFDPQTRKLSYVLTTEAPADTFRIFKGKEIPVREILKVDGCVNLDKVGQTPLLDTHRRGTVRDILGTQLNARIVGDTIVCEAQLSRRDEVRDIYCDIADGIIQKVSVGYSILDQKLGPVVAGQPPTVIVTKWAIDEGSLVPIPADMRAEIRSRLQLPTGELAMETDLDKAIAALTAASTALTAMRAAAKPTTPATSPADETEEQKAKREKEEADMKAKCEADMKAKQGKKDGDDDSGMDDDGRAKRSAADLKSIETLRHSLGPKGDALFESYVAEGFPMKLVRKRAYDAAGAAIPGGATQIVPPASALDPVGKGTRTQFVSIKQFESGKAS